MAAARAWIFGGSALLSLVAAPALAQPPADAGKAAMAQQCNAAYEKAQVLRKARKLRAARDELLLCSQSKCPGVIAADCGPWLREVESGLPSVVVVARDPSGADVPAVKVYVDGVLLTYRLSGTPIDVDPGEHTFAFEPERGQRVEQTVLVNMGEKNRLLQVTIRGDGAAAPAPAGPAKPGEAPKDEGKKGSFVPGIVVGALGLASLGVSFGMYFSAKSSLDQLRGSCAPHCAQADVDSVRTKGIVSDVTFGVGLAGIGAGVLMMILMRPTEKAATGALVPTPVLAPLPGGGLAGIAARF